MLAVKVRELIEQLSKIDPESKVLCYSEEQELLQPGSGFRLLEINGVTNNKGEPRRLDDGTPSIKFGPGPTSQQFAFIDVAADF